MAAPAAQLESAPLNRRVVRTDLWVLLAALCAHGPLLAVHLGQVWNRPHYCFALFLLPIVVWLMKQRWPDQDIYIPAKSLERLLLGGSCVCLSTAIWIHSPFLAAISAILATGFAILHVAGLRAIPALFGTWMLLWLAVPPPLGFDLLLISRMQSVTSQLASHLLDLLSINHLMAGNTLHLPGTTLFVDEACSGVHSLFALAGCTAVFAVISQKTIHRGVLLLASSLCWAMLLNLLRVMTISLAHVYWGIDLATGWPHELLGLVTFVFAVALMLSTDQWLHFVGYWIVRMSNYKFRKRTETSRVRYRPSSSLAVRHWGAMKQKEQSLWKMVAPSPTIRRMAIIAYGVLFATTVSTWGHTGTLSWTNFSLSELTSDFLPHSLGDWKQQHFERIERNSTCPLGQHSLVWDYRLDQSTADEIRCRLSLDFPFSGWHELTVCYESIGWRLEQRNVAVDAENPDLYWIESRFSKPTGNQATLIFGLMTPDGQPLSPPSSAGTARFVDRLRDQPAIQIQGFLEMEGPIDEQLQNDLRTMMHVVSSRTISALQEVQGGTPGG